MIARRAACPQVPEFHRLPEEESLMLVQIDLSPEELSLIVLAIDVGVSSASVQD